MSAERELIGFIDLVYEAILDGELWPLVLQKLADGAGAAQVAMPSFDWRANVFATVAPRFDPDLLAAYADYWAFKEPLVPRAASRPLGEVYVLENLISREEFAATPVFNEWWRRAGCGLAAMGANLVSEDRFSALVCLFNAPGKDELAADQSRFFHAALPHLMRAVRIHRQLRELEMKEASGIGKFDALAQAAILADAGARVIFTNAAGKALLDAGDGLCIREGRLSTCSNPDALHRLIGSCARALLTVDGAGGDLKVPRAPPRSPLEVTVIPLRSKTRLWGFPWMGSGSPVALVTVTDHDLDQYRRTVRLRRRFDLTSAEAAFAREILKGDGRKAAARRCGITDATAKSHLSSIFEKTGTHRQAELVRFLLDAADGQKA